MTHNGCGFNGGQCYAVSQECEGCKFAVEYPTGKYCQIFPDPASKWALGACNLASHVDRKRATAEQKVNPLKASKRSRKG